MEKPNLAYITKLSAGDKAFENKIISIIKEEFPTDRECYEQNIVSLRYGGAARLVHKLKLKISILGLEKSYDVANEYEKNLKNNKDDLKLEFEIILDIITNYLKEL